MPNALKFDAADHAQPRIPTDQEADAMALTTRERAKLEHHLQTLDNLRYIRAQLSLGKAQRVLVPARQDNFREIQWWLRSMLMISADEDGVEEARRLIADSTLDGKTVEIVMSTPPPFDAEYEKRQILAEGAHQTMINGVHVQLDIDQNKHQPASVPIGTRGINGQQFGTYATKAWHEGSTMAYMAGWAKDLPATAEGEKTYHGQAKRVSIDGVDDPVCFEGFSVTLGGTQYVSFHCYPNNR